MCGFTAYIGPNTAHQRAFVEQLCQRLQHRGPDDHGVLQGTSSCLAHRRLSIIDVEGGHQPLSDSHGNVRVVCNGEIYNHRALRDALSSSRAFLTRSDSEVLVHLYRGDDGQWVRQLDGMFAFVAADNASFVAARDALGIKPLFTALDPDQGRWFASELKAMPADCRELIEMPPGSVWTMSGGLQRWFDPSWQQPPAQPVEPDPGTLAKRLDAAVVKRLMSDVPLGVFLSGGLDSSIIAALVRRYNPHLHSFAVGLAGSPDLEAARVVARHLGTHHHEYVYTPEELFAALPTVIEHLESYDEALIRSAVPCYFVSKLAASEVKVVLSGEGADEAFAGYSYFGQIREPEALHRECVRLFFGLHNMNLQRVDRMTMAHGLEGRVPFLDLEFLEWAMAVDPRHKLHGPGRPEKWLLRQAFNHALPQQIVWRTKQEFAQGAGSEALLGDFAQQTVSDGDFARAASRFPSDTPRSKEALYYRNIFDELFPGEERRHTVGRWAGYAPL